MKKTLIYYFYFIICINPNTTIFNSVLFTFLDRFFPYLVTEGCDGRTDRQTDRETINALSII